MTPLVETLYHYALEHRADQYLHLEEPEYTDNQHMVTQALKRLQAMGGEARECAENLEYGAAVQTGIEREALFQAGLSLGLELSRL